MTQIKSSLRKHFIGLLNSQGSQERDAKAKKIAVQLFKLPAFISARTVLFYASLPGEVDTFAMTRQALQLKKQVALPVIVRDQKKMIPTLIDSLDDVTCGSYGICQPNQDASKTVDVADIDMVIVPGLAFDRRNNRLGRGAGYYDRFLPGLPKTAKTVGIAFDFQVVDSLPTEEHDVPLDLVIAG